MYKTYNLKDLTTQQVLALGGLLQFLKTQHYFFYDFDTTDKIYEYFDDEIVNVSRQLSTVLNESCVGQEYLASYEKTDNCILVFSCDVKGVLHVLYRVNLY